MSRPNGRMNTANRQLIPSGYRFRLFNRPSWDPHPGINRGKRNSRIAASDASADIFHLAHHPVFDRHPHEQKMYKTLWREYHRPHMVSDVYQTLEDFHT